MKLVEAAALTVRPAHKPDEGAEMLARHLDGDPRAFGELVDRYGSGVYGYLQRSGLGSAAADDLFQETFLRVHRAAGRYDPERPFATWLYTIASNLLRSHFRRRKVRRIMTGWWRRPALTPHAEPAEWDPPDRAAGPEQRLEQRQRVDIVARALDGLADGPRRALLLTRVEGLTLEEAAAALQAPVATVKTWVRRGRLQLAACLAEAEGAEPAEAEREEGVVS